ncbi:hypothetical protein ACFWGM_32215 [Streptomyces roseolus]|uniref:hypothetical protein n=1 Tax=Streptomyces roseolus TaxID=67358 RepID=UPI00362D52F3
MTFKLCRITNSVPEAQPVLVVQKKNPQGKAAVISDRIWGDWGTEATCDLHPGSGHDAGLLWSDRAVQQQSARSLWCAEDERGVPGVERGGTCQALTSARSASASGSASRAQVIVDCHFGSPSSASM